MIKHIKLAAACCFIVFAGCATNYGSDFSLDAAAKVKSGMTKDEVIALLGEPNSKTSRVGDEVWVWAHYNPWSKESRTAAVIFADGVVQPSPLTGKPVQ